MSWVAKFGKAEHESIMDMSENDIPLVEVDYLRIGSAHAVVAGDNNEILLKLLEKFVEEVNMPFDGGDAESNEIEIRKVEG